MLLAVSSPRLITASPDRCANRTPTPRSTPNASQWSALIQSLVTKKCCAGWLAAATSPAVLSEPPSRFKDAVRLPICVDYEPVPEGADNALHARSVLVDLCPGDRKGLFAAHEQPRTALKQDKIQAIVTGAFELPKAGQPSPTFAISPWVQQNRMWKSVSIVMFFPTPNCPAHSNNVAQNILLENPGSKLPANGLWGSPFRAL